MADNYLARSDVPFSGKVWEKIDEIVTGAAKSQLTARKLLYIEGPYGLGFKTLSGPDREVKGKGEGVLRVMTSETIPVLEIQAEFSLAARDIAAYDEQGLPLDAGPIAAAAITLARKEDDLLFNGDKDVGSPGLLTAKGTQTMKLSPWTGVGKAAEDLIKAATLLDDAGFHGPYTLALSPKLYNLLFRVYDHGNMTEFQHIESFITDGIVKASALKTGGILLASGRQYATIAIGQDMQTGFVGPAGRNFEFVIAESLTLRLSRPEAVCVLQP
jgi:uncharacterized linocin/CFP29 family protein